MKIVIGLVGEKGSGKGTFTRILKELIPQKNIVCIRFSDLLKETLILWDILLTRENLQDIAVVMDKGFGKGTVTHAVYKRIEKEKADIVIIDGVRWPTDVDMIRKFKHNFLIYITAGLKIRYERIKARKEKTGEEKTNLRQFLKEERALTEKFIPKIGKKADFIIENNKGLENLAVKVREFCGNNLQIKTKF